MKRRFNYTGRSRIPRQKISVILNKDGESAKSFTATIDLNGMNLPREAKVYVEAYHKTDVRRYDFGTVDDIIPPRNTGLATLAYSQNLKFRVLVVDESGHHGLILAHADRIKLVSDVDTKSILPVEFRDLGKQIWLIEFAGDEDAPILVVNKNIPNIENMAKSNPQFILHVYPAVIREVLTHMIFVDRVDSLSDPSVDWHGDWVNFARKILPGAGPPEVLDPQSDNFVEEDVMDWINKVVEEFCASRNEWSSYISQLIGEVA